jgi:hypothetical protein
MNWLRSLAPALGTALGGPLAGAAATFIADKLGISDKTVETVTDMLNSNKLNPEQVTQLKLAEIEFKTFLETNKIDLAKLEVENTKDARDMQKVTRSYTPPVLTFLITLGFFGVLFYMMYAPGNTSDALLVMLGSLGTAWTSSVAFWFGSTSSSQQKTNLLARAPAINE